MFIIYDMHHFRKQVKEFEVILLLPKHLKQDEIMLNMNLDNTLNGEFI